MRLDGSTTVGPLFGARIGILSVAAAPVRAGHSMSFALTLAFTLFALWRLSRHKVDRIVESR